MCKAQLLSWLPTLQLKYKKLAHFITEVKASFLAAHENSPDI
jgi:hypothetical protein